MLILQTQRLVIHPLQRPKTPVTNAQTVVSISFSGPRLLERTPLLRRELSFPRPVPFLSCRLPGKLPQLLEVVRLNCSFYPLRVISHFLCFDSDLPRSYPERSVALCHQRPLTFISFFLCLTEVMLMKCLALGFVALMITGLGGCTAVAVDPNAGFPDVSKLVSERVGKEVAWVPGTEEASPTLEAIEARLKDGLSENDAIEIALLNNRELQAIYSRLGLAQADLVQASLLHNPVIDATTGFPVGGGIVDLTFGIAMDFIDLLYTPLRKRVATAKFEETKLRVTTEVLDLVWRTQTAFHRHQANEQMLEMRRQVVASTTAAFELAQQIREAGNLRELDLASEHVLAEGAKLDLRLAEIVARTSRETLNMLMGLWGEEAQVWTAIPARLPDPPREPLDAESLESRAIERSLDLAAAEQLIMAATENVTLDRASGLLPELILGGKGERDGAEWEPGPTLLLPFPLFDRGQARIARARAELRQAREFHQALTVRIRAVTRSTRDRLDGHRDRTLRYRDILLPVWDRIVRETQLQYNAMQVGPLDLLRAKEQQIETASRYIDALREYWEAHADLALLLAGRLPPTEPAPAVPAVEQLPRFPFPTLQ